MREIKFRAWDKKAKKMSEPFNLIKEEEILGLDRINLYFYDCELMQYIGLKDESNREIYEGDVLEFRWFVFREKKRIVGFVEYKEPEFGVRIISPRDIKHKLRSLVAPVLNQVQFKIIGNIYENSELLKKGGET